MAGPVDIYEGRLTALADLGQIAKHVALALGTHYVCMYTLDEALRQWVGFNRMHIGS